MFKITIRKTTLLLTDLIVVNLTFLLALYLQYEGNVPGGMFTIFVETAFVVTLVKYLIYKTAGLYNSLWAYASIEELIKVVVAVLAGSAIGFAYMYIMGLRPYFGVYIVAFIMEVSVIGSIRFSYRVIRRIKNRQSLTRQNDIKKVLIIGCGATASMIATEIKNHPEVYGRVVGFIDDDDRKYGKNIAGIKVLGNGHDIYSVSTRYEVDEIIVAIPTISPLVTKEILTECKRCDAKVRIMPGVREVIGGQVSMSKIRDVEIEDLLGRDEVDLNVAEIASYIEDKVIMVTGGGGSIGSEICRQIARFNPAKLIVLDIYENNAYEIQNELLRTYGTDLELDVIIASVRDRNNIFAIIEEQAPNVIFHAAAHKHVPLMERSPKEAIKNNVFGTQNVAEAADKFGVERFVMISTDKAVNPTNIMGASKRMCEMIIQGLAKQSKTNFAAVRFGNVLGSNGSVVPLFKRQIEEGGPVTVTHKEIIRYFMTIPEASQLVIQAGGIANGGEIFILDMGEPVKIYDLATDLIKLSGLKIGQDIEIVITGLRPGEKLFEELLMDEEGLITTKYNKIHIGEPGEIVYPVLKKSFDHIGKIITNCSVEELIEFVQYIVPTYRNNIEVNRENKHKVESIDRYKRIGMNQRN